MCETEGLERKPEEHGQNVSNTGMWWEQEEKGRNGDKQRQRRIENTLPLRQV